MGLIFRVWAHRPIEFTPSKPPYSSTNQSCSHRSALPVLMVHPQYYPIRHKFRVASLGRRRIVPTCRDIFPPWVGQMTKERGEIPRECRLPVRDVSTYLGRRDFIEH